MASRKLKAPKRDASVHADAPSLRNEQELTPAEQTRLSALREGLSVGRPPKVKYASTGSGKMVLSLDPGQNRVRWVMGLFSAMGTSDFDLANHFLAELGTLVNGELLAGSLGKNDPDRMAARTNAALAMMHGIAPRNELEAMLAVQMVGTQALAMEMLQRAGDSTEAWRVEQALNHANKLMRTFTAQVEALQRLRGTVSQQRVVVEHVHVEAGGQAVVGAVSTPGGGARTKNG